MDPLTAGLNLANSIVTLLTKVWDATPAAQQVTGAADVATTLHNMAEFLHSAQDKINGLVKP
jgi:hypothetical protein